MNNLLDLWRAYDDETVSLNIISRSPFPSVHPCGLLTHAIVSRRGSYAHHDGNACRAYRHKYPDEYSHPPCSHTDDYTDATSPGGKRLGDTPGDST